jgi:hypothetical protein
MNSLSDNQPQQLPRVSVQNRNDFSILDDRSGT